MNVGWPLTAFVLILLALINWQESFHNAQLWTLLGVTLLAWVWVWWRAEERHPEALALLTFALVICALQLDFTGTLVFQIVVGVVALLWLIWFLVRWRGEARRNARDKARNGDYI